MDKYQKLISAINQSKFDVEKKNKLINLVNIKKKVDRASVEALYEEAWKMYDSFIDQFYNYTTTSYIRHGETKPGTQQGSNLYRAQDFELIKNSHYVSFSINFTDRDMEYKNYKDSAMDVLQNVLTGYRYKHTFETKTIIYKWRGKYRGRYFSTSGSVTIYDAFESFKKQYADMWAKALSDNWRRYY